MKLYQMLRQYKIYRKLAAILAVIVAFTALALGTALYAFFSRTMFDEIGRMSVSSLHQVDFVVQDLNARTTALCNQLIGDTDVLATMHRSPTRPLEVYNASQLMKLTRNTQPYISWLGVYNSKTRRLYNTAGLRSADENAIIENLSAATRLDGRTDFLLLEYEAADHSSAKAIGFANFSTLAPDDDAYGAVVVGVSPNYLSSLMRRVNIQTEDAIMLLDQNGYAVAHSDPEKAFMHLGGQESLSRAFSSKADGCYKTIVDGTYKLISHVYSQKYGWTIIHEQPYSNLQSRLDSILFYALLSSAALMIIGIWVSLWLTSRAYRPVARILSRSGYASDGVGGIGDEAEYIVDQMKRKLALEDDSRAYTPLVKEALLLQLFTDWQSDVGTDALSRLGLDLTGPFYVVLIFSFDGSNPFGQKRNEARSALHILASDLLSPHAARVDAAAVNSSDLGVLLQLESAALPESLHICLSEIRRILAQSFDASISIAAGSIEADVDSVAESYRCAQEKLSYRFFEGFGCILISDLDVEGRSVYQPTSSSAEEQLYVVLKEGAKNKILPALQPFFAQMRTLSPAGAVLSANQLVISILRNLPIAEVSRDAQAASVRAMESIILCSTQDELEEMLAETCVKLSTLETKNDKKKDIDPKVKEMILYLEKNYRDESISLAAAAEYLGYSSVYLGKLFRMNVGKSFSETLTQYRLEKAAALLAGSASSITEICAEIGLSNVNYFYAQFKKRYKCTPQSYRQQAQNTG
ncbi:MAG: helix-turn-helix domain-containing protein [Clostridiales bacterium]|nr:helix-turn-helix domain-containing protein [Clostridiales bacterium]